MQATTGQAPQEPGSTAQAGRQAHDPTYGGLTRAIERAAPQLGRFTNVQMAQAVQREPSAVHERLKRLLTLGKVRKEGITYVWQGQRVEEGVGKEQWASITASATFGHSA